MKNDMKNREIKFRVWDTQYKCWCEKSSHDWIGSGIGNLGSYDKQPCMCMSFDGKIMHNDNMGGFVDDDQSVYVLQQFTGYKDFKNKEIYEGDILYVIYSEGHERDSTYDWDGYFEVVFDDGWYLKNKEKSYCLQILDYKRKKYECYEIIGNIFENPNLLK